MPTPARTSIAAIVEAARVILEADGLEGLTMQRVGQAVGVRPPSLYKRVRSRGELVRLVVEDVAAQLAREVGRAAGSGDPHEALQAMAYAFRRFAHQNPGAYAVLFGPLPEDSRPELSTLGAASEAVLATAGALAGPEHALEGARMIVAWVHGFVSMELSGAFRLAGDVEDAFAFGIQRLAVALAARDPQPRRTAAS
jgi:AcrR family transcriptional regulator